MYGHDLAARTQLEAMLRRWNLEPVILEQLPSEGTTLIEKLEKYARDDVRFGVVFATPTNTSRLLTSRLAVRARESWFRSGHQHPCRGGHAPAPRRRALYLHGAVVEDVDDRALYAHLIAKVVAEPSRPVGLQSRGR
jgi:hypothetical protein